MKNLVRVAPIYLKLVFIVSLFCIVGIAQAQTVDFRGLLYSPLGDATLDLIGTSETGVLSIDDIGVSGLDGAVVELPDVCGYWTRWDALVATRLGDVLRFRVLGRFNEERDQLKGVVDFEQTESELTLSVDLYPPDTIIRNQIIVKDGFSTVYSDVIPDRGVIATAAAWPDEMELISACSDAVANWLAFAWDSPTTISVAGGPDVSADAVLIMSQAFDWDFSAVHLEAAGISPIVILDSQFGFPSPSAVDHPRSLQLTLWDPIPNPFNPRTEIQFSLVRSATVRLAVHDAQGRLVRTLLHAPRDAGTHSVVWDGTDASGDGVSSGVYLVSLRSDAEIRRQKVTLVR